MSSCLHSTPGTPIVSCDLRGFLVPVPHTAEDHLALIANRLLTGHVAIEYPKISTVIASSFFLTIANGVVENNWNHVWN